MKVTWRPTIAFPKLLNLLSILSVLVTSPTRIHSSSTQDTCDVDHDNTSTSSTTAQEVKETIFLGEDSYEVLEVLPHAKDAFTQGLTLYNGYLYEGTGLHGSSELRKLYPENPSRVIQSYTLPSNYFGEGISHYVDKNDGSSRFIQLTWKEKTGFIYNADTMELIDDFQYDTVTGEGWGITFLSESCEFVVSDGSKYLIFWDCVTFQETKRIEVTYYKDNKKLPISMINELEVIKIKNKDSDERFSYAILANVWFQDLILLIDPHSGNVMKIYDFRSLYPRRMDGANADVVFNGISISNDADDTIYVTGKLWPHMYKVKLIK